MNCPFCRYPQSETYIRILNPPQYMLPRQQSGSKPTLEQAQQMDMQEFKNQVLAELRSELQPKIASVESLSQGAALEAHQQSQKIEELLALVQVQSSQLQNFERKAKQAQNQSKENVEALQRTVLQLVEQLRRMNEKQQQQQELLLKLQLKQKECARLQSAQQPELQSYVDSKLSEHSAKIGDVAALYNELTGALQESLQHNQDLSNEVEALQGSVGQLQVSVQQSAMQQSQPCNESGLVYEASLESPMVCTNLQMQKQRCAPQIVPARVQAVGQEEERDQVVQYINTSVVKQRSASPRLVKTVANPRNLKTDQQLQTSNISTYANEAQTSQVCGQDVCLQHTNSSSPHSVVHLSDPQSQRMSNTSSYQQSNSQRWQNTMPDSGTASSTSKPQQPQQQQQMLNQSRSSNLSSPQKQQLQFSESQIPIAQKVFYEYGRASQSNYYSRIQPSGQLVANSGNENSNQSQQQQVMNQQSYEICSSDQLKNDFPVVDRVIQSDNYRHKQVLNSSSQPSCVQQQIIDQQQINSQHDSNQIIQSNNPLINSKILETGSTSKKSDITKSNSAIKSDQLVSQQKSPNTQQSQQQIVKSSASYKQPVIKSMTSETTKEQNQFQNFIEEQQQLHNSIASLHSEHNELPPRPTDPEQLKYSRIEQKLQQRQDMKNSNQLTTAAFDLSQKPINQTGITPSLLQTVKPLNVYEINQKQQQLMSKVDQAYIDLQPVQSMNSSIRFEEYEPRQSLQSD